MSTRGSTGHRGHSGSSGSSGSAGHRGHSGSSGQKTYTNFADRKPRVRAPSMLHPEVLPGQTAHQLKARKTKKKKRGPRTIGPTKHRPHFGP